VWDIDQKMFSGKTKQVKMLLMFMDKFVKPLRQIFKETSNFLIFNNAAFKLIENTFNFDEEKKDRLFQLSITRQHFQKTLKILTSTYNIQCEDMQFMRLQEVERFHDIYLSLQLSQDSYTRNMEMKKEKEEKPAMVTLSTVHSFKGRQSDYIFVANLRPVMPFNFNDFEMKCVFYVAMTRACKKLYLSSSEKVLTYAGKLMQSPENPFLNHYISCVNRLKQEHNL